LTLHIINLILFISIKPFVALSVNAIDTTAAGDAFVGTIAAELSFGNTLDYAVARAAKCAAITVTRKGAQQSIPTKKEIDSFIF
jgi:ribokinase